MDRFWTAENFFQKNANSVVFVVFVVFLNNSLIQTQLFTDGGSAEVF